MDWVLLISGLLNTFANTVVDVDFGEEYIVDLEFSSSLTIGTSTVPEPSSTIFLAVAIGFAGIARRRR